MLFQQLSLMSLEEEHLDVHPQSSCVQLVEKEFAQSHQDIKKLEFLVFKMILYWSI